MTKLILIAVLFFTANVAGAEVTYLCKYNSEGNFSEGIRECPPRMLFKEQPEAGAHILTCHARDKTRCMDWDIAKEQADAEKWRELCELYLGEAKAFLSDFDKEASQQIIVNAQLATAYCTRYNGALLEEIRNKNQERSDNEFRKQCLASGCFYMKDGRCVCSVPKNMDD